LKRKRPSLDERPIPAMIVRAYERYLSIALALPGSVASPPAGSAWRHSRSAHGTPSVRVYGKLLSRWRTEAECGLAIRCDFLDRQIMLQARPDVFFLTDHYVNYPMVLVRMEKASVAILKDVAERGWRFVAPAKLVRQRAADASG
jgi:hypothetical protein